MNVNAKGYDKVALLSFNINEPPFNRALVPTEIMILLLWTTHQMSTLGDNLKYLVEYWKTLIATNADYINIMI